MLSRLAVMSTRPRIIVASRAAQERETLAEWLLADGYDPVLVGDALLASAEMASRPSLAFVVDYALTERADLHGSWRSRRPQTPPVVIGEADPAAHARTEGLNAIYLERPLDRVTLLCMVLMAILEGRPERRSPRRPANVTAKVNGSASRIVDLSLDGLRIELPRAERVPPPVFRLAVPLAGLTLNVRRMWTATPGRAAARADVLWCGVALANNPQRAADTWRGFVETAPGR